MPERPSGDRIDLALRAVVTRVGEAAAPPPERLADAVNESTITMPTPFEPAPRRQTSLILAGVAVAALIIGVLTLALRDDEGGSDIGPHDEPDTTQTDTPKPTGGEPTILDAFTAAGGLDGLTLGVAEGAFELVTFDPSDRSQVLAAVRDGYGPAANQDTTETWTIAGGVTQALWAAETPHDFAHYNPDGSITRWVLSGPGVGEPIRTADIISPSGEVTTTAAVGVARAVVDAGTAFVLTHDDQASGYGALVALAGDAVTELADGDSIGWVDRPAPGVVVAYPAAESGGTTRAWDSSTLEELPDHPLAGQSALRIALSGDGSLGLRIRLDGTAELFEPTTGGAGPVLSTVDPTAVEHAATLNDDGSLAITIDTTGLVTVWSTADGEPVFEVDADSATPRLVTEQIGSRATSAVSFDGTRLAVRYPAQGTERVRYEIIDLASWLP